MQAELDEARYYLENTTMIAPEDGHIINLQVVPGMVAGSYRIGAIASFIVDKDRYFLGNFFQEHLKYVKPGQPVEAALDQYSERRGRFKGAIRIPVHANSPQLEAFSPGMAQLSKKVENATNALLLQNGYALGAIAL